MVVVPPIGTPLSSLPPQVVDSGRSSNGKTADSGSAYRGSNPCLPALGLLSLFITTTYEIRKTLGVRKIKKVDTKRFHFCSSQRLPWPERQFLPCSFPRQTRDRQALRTGSRLLRAHTRK